MSVNAGKHHFWEYCPCRYSPVNIGKYRWQIPVANTAGKCQRPTLVIVIQEADVRKPIPCNDMIVINAEYSPNIILYRL